MPPKSGKLKGKSGAARGFKRKVMDLKTRGRDVDRIQDDIALLLAGKAMPGVIDEDAPGGGHHYCVACARHFITAPVLDEHLRSKVHKKRIKVVSEQQYTQAEADAGAGCSGIAK